MRFVNHKTMRKTLFITLFTSFGLFAQYSGNQQKPAENINYATFSIKKQATKPPLGWNSWDVFGCDVTEAEVKAQADYMAKNLLPLGYNTLTIDIAWYSPDATAVHEKYKDPKPNQLIDAYGRLIPDPKKFPSGLKGLADYLHSKGLKLGIHVMRGMPWQAIEQNTPILGTNYKAKDIFKHEDRCVFYDGLYSVDMSKPGAQEYYNSVLKLYAEWGIDFIKADDMTSYPQHYAEVKAFRYALEQSGRPMVLSLSPGSISFFDRSYAQYYADMFRITADFWDEWKPLKNAFGTAALWSKYTGPGGWADLDMIPLGKINIRGENGTGERMSRFTKDEQYTLMTLWSIFRSPLILGMDMTQLDEFTKSLITNRDMLNINQNSVKNRVVSFKDEKTVWAAESADGKEKYVALFNLSDKPETVALVLNELGINTEVEVFDIWEGKNTGKKSNEISATLAPHACKYFKIK